MAVRWGEALSSTELLLCALMGPLFEVVVQALDGFYSGVFEFFLAKLGQPMHVHVSTSRDFSNGAPVAFKQIKSARVHVFFHKHICTCSPRGRQAPKYFKDDLEC